MYAIPETAKKGLRARRAGRIGRFVLRRALITLIELY
jgi:hypothetical protein